jgi:hypothetical protein
LLHDLRSITRLIRAAHVPDVPPESIARYYEAWDASRERGLLRISSWLTGAAAALLIGSLILWPRQQAPAPEMAGSSVWEMKAIMPPPPELTLDRPDELIELAQWMADDLSADALR